MVKMDDIVIEISFHLPKAHSTRKVTSNNKEKTSWLDSIVAALLFILSTRFN